MATPASIKIERPPVRDPDAGHRLRWRIAATCGVLLVACLVGYGWSYYLAPVVERTHSPIHHQLRPSGSIGLRLGMVSGLLFVVIFLYPLRKRWSWLGRIGKTKRWLDFHILCGLFAPVLITFHSSFKFQGVAGMAFWIMWAVAMSGIVGRYFYGQIPRHLTAAEMTLKEIEESRDELSQRLNLHTFLEPAEIERIFHVPDASEVQRMSLPRSLFTMLWLDFVRPFQISRLRRRTLSPFRALISLGGLLPMGSSDLEENIGLVRKQTWLSTKIVFLAKTQRVFHLWHVVHRPFSYSFAVLVILHVGFVILLGYF